VISFRSDVPSKEIVQSAETGEKPIDEDLGNVHLAEDCLKMIPKKKFALVVKTLAALIVDKMPNSTVNELTGKDSGQDMAEAILFQYYLVVADPKEVLTDAFKIVGESETLYHLDLLNLTES
jgi:hypothetical protein